MEQLHKEIIISKESIIGDIQQSFNQLYPFLKIDFFKEARGTTVFKKTRINAICTIGEISSLTMPTNLNVDAGRTITQIATDCFDAFGLFIQIFRKSGNVWIAISLTDNWTLESQNNAGEFISTEMKAAS